MEPDAVLATDFATIARTLSSGPDVQATLRLIMDVAVRTVEGCRHAGVFVIDDTDTRTVASSDPLVEQTDLLQMQLDEGPCLDALRSNLAYVASDDLAVDPNYPTFGPQSAALGVRSALGLRLFTDHRLGAMNLYGDLPHAFGIVDRAKAVILASHCSTALDIAQTQARTSQDNRDDMRAALASREIIGQAQGILIERERITAEEAFDVLRKASQDLNVKLRDIAQRLVDTGEDPRSAPASRPHSGAT